MDFPRFVLAFYAAYALNLVLHEGGHALGAWLLRFRLLEIRLGRGGQLGVVQIKHCRIIFYPLPVCGWVYAVPTRPGSYRLAYIIFTAAGPLASLLSAVAAWIFAAHHHYGPASMAFLVAGLYFWLGTFVPAEGTMYGQRVANDGLLLLRYLFKRDAECAHGYGSGLFVESDRAREAGRYRRAERFYRRALRALQRNPSLTELRAHASMLIRIDRLDEALLRFRAMVKLSAEPSDPARAEAAMGISWIAVAWQRPDLLREGRELIDAAVAAFPSHLALRRFRVAVLYEQGEREAARAEATVVLETTKSRWDEVVCRAYLARIAHDEGRSDEAQTLAGKVRSELPQFAFDATVQRVADRLLKPIPVAEQGAAPLQTGAVEAEYPS